MAIKINLESVKIPVEIGDLKFEIDVMDEKYETFISNFNIFLEKIESFDGEKSEDIELLKTMVSEVYDELLGIGSYDQVYAKMPNIAFVTSVLVNIVTQLVEEMDNRIAAKLKSKITQKRSTKKK